MFADGLFRVTVTNQSVLLHTLPSTHHDDPPSGHLLSDVQLLTCMLHHDCCTGGLNVTPGAEFVAARLASEKTGSQLVLGDRPIEITLQVSQGRDPDCQLEKISGET